MNITVILSYFLTMASKGHRGQLLLAKAKAKTTKLQPQPEMKTFRCFKCKFFSTNETFLDRHMTFFHLLGPEQRIAMEKFIAISNPNLLLSTFHRNSGEDTDGESDISGLHELHDDLVDQGDQGDKGDQGDQGYQGDQGAQENHGDQEDEAEVPPTGEMYSIIDDDNILNDGFMNTPNTPGTSQTNVVSQVLSGARRRIRPSFSVNSVTNSAHPSIQRVTSTGGIRTTPQRQAQKRNKAGKENLVAGGNKKMKDVKDIGAENIVTKSAAHQNIIVRSLQYSLPNSD